MLNHWYQVIHQIKTLTNFCIPERNSIVRNFGKNFSNEGLSSLLREREF